MEPIVLAVRRKSRPSEKLLRRTMAVLAVAFLLQGIVLSRGFMLPCFLMAIGYYVYGQASNREYEYTLGEKAMLIERVGDHGRRLLHEINYNEILLLCDPEDPEAARYRKGGGTPVYKYDYSSYEENVPYYVMIVKGDGKTVKLLLDLTPDAISFLRRRNRDAVRI